ncbi:MAG: diaminopimelate epimerase [Actinomycetota bacterium]
MEGGFILTEIRFAKYHSLGNDFIIMEDLKSKLDLSPRVICKICDRHFGIGADGLILVRPAEGGDFFMLFFNSDGSQAEMCGNGIRCLAKYLYDQGLALKTAMTIETLSGAREVLLLLKGKRVEGAKVDMGLPIFKPELIPILTGGKEVIDQPIQVGKEIIKATCLSMGNPHCVIFVEDIRRAPVKRLGSVIKNLPIFPNKVNVEFAQIVNSRQIHLRVWERGVGETLACGTGACAAVVAAIKNELTERKVTVKLPGGKLDIEWAKDNHVYLAGPVEKVFTGIVEI